MRKTSALWIGTLLVMNIGCGRNGQGIASERAATNVGPVTVESPKPPAKVTKEMAVATAKADYIRTIGPLKGIDFDVSDEPDGWRVNFYPHVRNGTIAGGSGLYLIDKETGKILDLKLNQ